GRRPTRGHARANATWWNAMAPPVRQAFAGPGRPVRIDHRRNWIAARRSTYLQFQPPELRCLKARSSSRNSSWVAGMGPYVAEALPAETPALSHIDRLCGVAPARTAHTPRAPRLGTRHRRVRVERSAMHDHKLINGHAMFCKPLRYAGYQVSL